MKLFQSSQDRDLELLSAYIDDELSANERATLERRLASDVGLRQTLNSLRRVQTTLHALPKVKAPRSFVLKPEMVGQPTRQLGLGRLIPALNFATTLAAIVFAVVIGSQLATSGQPSAAPLAAQSPVVQVAPADGQPTSPELPNASSLKSLTAPAVTESTPLVVQAPGCGDSAQEPLTGGGCGGGEGGGGDAQVSPFAFSATDGTATVTPNPADATDTTVAGGGVTTESSTAAASGTAGESAPPVANDAPTLTQDQLQVQAGTPAPDTFGTTLNNYATTTEPISTDSDSAASLSPVTLIEYALGGLLVLLIVASILIRRR